MENYITLSEMIAVCTLVVKTVVAIIAVIKFFDDRYEKKKKK